MQSKEEVVKNLSPISYVRVEPNLSSVLGLGSFVEWDLHPKFSYNGDLVFFLEKSYSASGPWAVVSTVINQFFAYDFTAEPGYNPQLESYYRVRLKVVDPSKAEPAWYSSDVVSSNAYWWNKRDYLLSKEIIRRELVRMKRGSGNVGYFLKRKTFGRPCPVCLDKATGKATDSQCPTCFGTGYDGGYYDPLLIWIEFGEDQVLKKVGEVGMQVQISSMARTPAFPDITSNDVWINKYTGQVYRIGSTVADVAKVRNIPLIKQLTFTLLPTSDILYSYGNPKNLENRILNKDPSNDVVRQ